MVDESPKSDPEDLEWILEHNEEVSLFAEKFFHIFGDCDQRRLLQALRKPD